MGFQSKAFRAPKCSVSLVDYFSSGPTLSMHWSCLSQSLTKQPWSPHQLLMEPCLGQGGRQRHGEMQSLLLSSKFPADTTVILDSTHPKAPRLTYLFNFDYSPTSFRE